MSEILIVGAGLSGAVYARSLAEAGLTVRVIDKRSHIGGNCHDHIDPETGVRCHTYGPHLFHTSNMRVVDWLSRFTGWLPYEHRVVARLEDRRLVPMPVNADTIAALYDRSFAAPAEVEGFLSEVAESRAEVKTAEDHLLSIIGPQLTDLFFRRYTAKMWDMDLSQMGAEVVRRLKIRTDREDRYFPGDSFQALPDKGYTAMFEAMLDHPKIKVELDTAFEHRMLAQFDHCFNAMPIDVFFAESLGPLPYRSIRFHTSRHPLVEAPPHVTINYTDESAYTRETWWHNLPGHAPAGQTQALRTVEEPCDYRDNNLERYYPVKTADKRFDTVYKAYARMASSLGNITFIGRCGTYQYLDMHQVVNQSLMGVQAWLDRAAAA